MESEVHKLFSECVRLNGTAPPGTNHNGLFAVSDDLGRHHGSAEVARHRNAYGDLCGAHGLGGRDLNNQSSSLLRPFVVNPILPQTGKGYCIGSVWGFNATLFHILFAFQLQLSVRSQKILSDR